MLSKDSLRSALADVQYWYYRALSDGNDGLVDIMLKEMDRIETLLETYDD